MVFKLNSHGGELVTDAIGFLPVLTRTRGCAICDQMRYLLLNRILIALNEHYSAVTINFHIKTILPN